jgi:hypothetical protein
VCSARICAAEALHSHPVDIYIVRTAEQLQSPHILTYRVVEWEQMRGRWIAPDLGYYDSGYGKEQIWIAGAGAVLVQRRRFSWEQELYVSQEAGPESHNRRSLWIWPVVNLQPKPRLSAQVAAYPTIPLNHAQRWGYDIDRAKIEWAVSPHWRAGFGYSGGLCSERTWQNYPFFTVTRKTPAGNFEAWLQSTPGGGQVQMRYLLVREER